MILGLLFTVLNKHFTLGSARCKCANCWGQGALQKEKLRLRQTMTSSYRELEFKHLLCVIDKPSSILATTSVERFPRFLSRRRTTYIANATPSSFQPDYPGIPRSGWDGYCCGPWYLCDYQLSILPQGEALQARDIRLLG